MWSCWLAAAAGIVTRINSLFLAVSGVLAALIMLAILQDVVRRYAFNDPSAWVLDVCSFMLVYLFFLALAPTLQAGGHVSVDLFTRLIPQNSRGAVVILGAALTCFFGAVLFWMLLDETIEAFRDDIAFPASTIPVKVKYIWVIGPVGAAQFVLTALLILAGTVRGQRPR